MILIFYSILFFVFSIYIDSTHRVFQEILKYFSCFDFINEYIIHPKLIDEIRYRNKDKSIPLDIFDNNISDATDNSYEYLYIQLFEYVQKTLEQQEFEFFCEFVKTLNIKQT